MPSRFSVGTTFGKGLDFGAQDAETKLLDLVRFRRRGVAFGERDECRAKCMRKHLCPVSVGGPGGGLHVIDDGPHFGWSEMLVIEHGDEAFDRSLEMDVVFPEGVVGVDQQMLRSGDDVKGGGFDIRR